MSIKTMLSQSEAKRRYDFSLNTRVCPVCNRNVYFEELAIVQQYIYPKKIIAGKEIFRNIKTLFMHKKCFEQFYKGLNCFDLIFEYTPQEEFEREMEEKLNV